MRTDRITLDNWKFSIVTEPNSLKTHTIFSAWNFSTAVANINVRHADYISPYVISNITPCAMFSEVTIIVLLCQLYIMFCTYWFYLIVDLYCLIISKFVVILKMRQAVSKCWKKIMDEVSDFLFVLSRIQIKNIQF